MIGVVIPISKRVSSEPYFLKSLNCIVGIGDITKLPTGKLNVKFHAFLNHSISFFRIENFNFIFSDRSIRILRRPFLNTFDTNFRSKTLQENVSRIGLCLSLRIFYFAGKVGIVNMLTILFIR